MEIFQHCSDEANTLRGGTDNKYSMYHNIFRSGDHKCPICFIKFRSNDSRRRHIPNFHSKDRELKCPYTSILNQGLCILGCNFESGNPSQMRNHLIIYHSAAQLEFFGISRNYLKFQANMIRYQDLDL